MSFTREVTVEPAYDCTKVQPCVHGFDDCSIGENVNRNHGKRAAHLRLALVNGDNEVSVTLSTGWYLPETVTSLRHDAHTMGVVIAWHSRDDLTGTEAFMRENPEDCPRGWARCYADVNYGYSHDLGLLLVTKGTEAVWQELETLYYERFTKEDER